MSDLTDAEFAELDGLLAAAPYDLQPLDAVSLDGYLCGVLVQPRLVPQNEWLPPVFGEDVDAQTLAARAAPDWLERCTTLIARRHAALNRAIAEDGGFDPLILEDSEDADADDAASADADSAPETTAPDPADDEAAALLASVPAYSRPLLPWVSGFDYALQSFPALEDEADDAIASTLARLYRHLPADDDETREVVRTIEAEFPLADVDDAIGDLVVAVVELWDLTQAQRYRVETVRRDAPKVGRNDPCPCGSGKKFKQCHGRVAD